MPPRLLVAADAHCAVALVRVGVLSLIPVADESRGGLGEARDVRIPGERVFCLDVVCPGGAFFVGIHGDPGGSFPF